MVVLCKTYYDRRTNTQNNAQASSWSFMPEYPETKRFSYESAAREPGRQIC